jgi:hypothetical protein
MQSYSGVSYGEGAGIGTTFTAIDITEDAINYPGSATVPLTNVKLHACRIHVATASGSPTTISAYLAHDSAGVKPITSPAAVDAVTLASMTMKTDYGYTMGLDEIPHSYMGSGTPGSIYLLVKTDAGTIDVDASLDWEQSV